MKRLLPRIALSVTTIALCFGLLEIGLRLFGYDPLGHAAEGSTTFLRLSDDPDLDYEPVPGFVGAAEGSEISINSYGFRDKEYPVERRPGVPRLVVVGDSIAFGVGITPGAAFPEVLESLLAESGRPGEVLNLSVSGYDTLNEVAFFERVGARFAPDVVIVAYCINDLGTHSVELTLMRIMDNYGFLIRHSRALQLLASRASRVQDRLVSQFHVGETEEEFRRANEGRILPVADDPEVQRIAGELLRVYNEVKPDIAYPFLAWYLSEPRLGRLRYAFERLAARAHRDGFEVLVLLIPFLDDNGHPEAYRLAYDLVRHEASRLGFTVIDPTEEFRERGFDSLMLRHGRRLDVLHPNEEGHRILARRIAAALM